jgi:hypothetical protein
MEKKSKSKTFPPETDFGEIIQWVSDNIETHDYQPEGVSSYNDGLTPHDPVCEIPNKLTVTLISYGQQESRSPERY